MAIQHTIRKNGNNEFKEVKLTALRAIRFQCVECMGWAYSEIELCLSPNCPLFPYRFGKSPVGYEIVDSSDLESVDTGEDFKCDCVVSERMAKARASKNKKGRKL